MNTREFEKLLSTADADVPAPRVPRELAARVRTGRGRSSPPLGIWRAAAAVLVALGLASAFRAQGPQLEAPEIARHGAGPAEPARVERVAAALPRVESELRVLLQTVKGVEAARRRAARLPEVEAPPAPSPAAVVRQEVESAADALVAQAIRCERELHLLEAARRRYELVIEVFPETPAAADARVRLAALGRTAAPAS